MLRSSSVLLVLGSALVPACGGTVVEGNGQDDAAPPGDEAQDDAPRANPLYGTWRFTEPAVNGMTIGGEVTFESSGLLSETVQISDCTGTENVSGATWKSTPTTVTVMTGTEACSGSLTCDGVTTSCATESLDTISMCTYALSNGGDTLTLSGCDDQPGKSLVLTRD